MSKIDYEYEESPVKGFTISNQSSGRSLSVSREDPGEAHVEFRISGNPDMPSQSIRIDPDTVYEMANALAKMILQRKHA